MRWTLTIRLEGDGFDRLDAELREVGTMRVLSEIERLHDRALAERERLVREVQREVNEA